MQIYSQKDPRWSRKKLGTCNTTIGKAGCKITCYAMLADMTPDRVNKILTENDGYVRGCLTVDAKDCDILGLEYKGRVYTDPRTTCIAETDYYKSVGVPQHFFIYANGLMVDPLEKSPRWEKCTYDIVSYRLIENNMNIYKDTISKSSELLDFEYGNNLNDNEAEEYVETIGKLLDELKELDKQVDKMSEKLDKFDDANSELADALAKEKKKNESLGRIIDSVKKENETLKETVDELEKDKQGRTLFKGFGIIIKKT